MLTMRSGGCGAAPSGVKNSPSVVPSGFSSIHRWLPSASMSIVPLTLTIVQMIAS